MHTFPRFSTFLFFILLPCLLMSQTSTGSLATQKIIKKASIPGLSLAQLNGGNESEILSLGWKNAQTKEPVNQQTLFSAASLSKPVVAYIVLQLVHQGRFDLDHPLIKYYNYPDVVDDPRHLQVTARHVLTHTSGLPNWRPRGKALAFKQDPGVGFSYSGEGFVWLASVLESIAGKGLEDLAQEMVFRPLGMNRSSYIWRDTLESNYALPHDTYGNPQKKYKATSPNAAASLQTTAHDYALFLAALLEAKLISKELQAEMFRPQVEIQTYEGKTQKISWGLGVGLQEKADGLEFWHWGDNGTFKAYFSVSPTTKNGLVYFANSSNGLSITKDLTDLYLGTDQAAVRWNNYSRLGLWWRIKKLFK